MISVRRDASTVSFQIPYCRLPAATGQTTVCALPVNLTRTTGFARPASQRVTRRGPCGQAEPQPILRLPPMPPESSESCDLSIAQLWKHLLADYISRFGHIFHQLDYDLVKVIPHIIFFGRQRPRDRLTVTVKYLFLLRRRELLFRRLRSNFILLPHK